MITVAASQLLNVDDLTAWDVIDFTVGPHADPLILLWERPTLPPPDPDYAEYPSIESNWIRWDRPNRFRILHYDTGGLEVLDLPETVQTYHHVQPLPGGEYLLVAGWPREELPNADVYSADGRLLRSWQAGLCVTHLQATTDGAIWAGYSDKGVLEDDQLALNGVTCFGADGRVLISFNDVALSQGVENILHCYAMNVTSNAEAWLWYCDWSGERFPVVRVVDGRIDGYWPAGKHYPLRVPPYAFAVADDGLFFYGDNLVPYRFYFIPLSLFGKLSTDVRIVMDEGSRPGGIHDVGWRAWLERFRRFGGFEPERIEIEAFGRGSRLFLWKDRTLLVVDAASISWWQ